MSKAVPTFEKLIGEIARAENRNPLEAFRAFVLCTACALSLGARDAGVRRSARQAIWTAFILGVYLCARTVIAAKAHEVCLRTDTHETCVQEAIR